MMPYPSSFRAKALSRASCLVSFGFAVLMLAGCGAVPSTYPAPAADADACFDQGRRQFYDASNAAVAAEQRRQALETIANLSRTQIGQRILLTAANQNEIANVAVRASLSLLDTVRKYASEDAETIREVGARFEETTKCRQAEMRRIRSDMRAGRITRQAAREQAAKLQREASADAAVARDVTDRLRARNAAQLIAVREIDTALPASDPNLASRRAETAAIRDTVQTNQRALAAQSTAISKAEDASLFQISELRWPRAFA
jgi:hypothetical protein